jgi:hypothetical protein
MAKNKVIEMDFVGGTSIDEAAIAMQIKALRDFCTVKASFNGHPLVCTPSTNAIDIAKEYRAFFDRQSREYRNSPEGKQAEAERKAQKINALAAPAKEFPTEVVLSVVTDRLLTKPGAGGAKNGIYAMYEFIEHCLASSCFDIVAPKMASALRPLLLEQFPELAIAEEKVLELDELTAVNKGNHSLPMIVEYWIATLGLPSSYLVPVCVYE